MSTIDLSKCSPEQIKEIMNQAKELEKLQKENRKRNHKSLVELSEQFVDDNVDFFIDKQLSAEDGIVKLFEEAQPIIDLRAELYGEEKKNQDSFTSTKKDGSASIKIGWNVRPTFDGTESTGIQKIKKFMASLAGENENERLLMDFLNIALKTDIQGNYNPKKVRELNTMRERANSDLFNEGMDIIDAALIDIRTSMYARGYKMVTNEKGITKRIDFSFSVK